LGRKKNDQKIQIAREDLDREIDHKIQITREKLDREIDQKIQITREERDHEIAQLRADVGDLPLIVGDLPLFVDALRSDVGAQEKAWEKLATASDKNHKQAAEKAYGKIKEAKKRRRS